MSTSRRVENLDDRAQNAQLRVGVATMFLGLAVSVVLHKQGASPLAHLALIPIFLVGSYGMAAGLARTCGITALTGRRRTEHGPEPIADRRELAAVRKRGLAVIGGSLLLSIATALLLSLVH
jgi:hypothetical protein